MAVRTTAPSRTLNSAGGALRRRGQVDEQAAHGCPGAQHLGPVMGVVRLPKVPTS